VFTARAVVLEMLTANEVYEDLKRFGLQRKRWSRFYERSTAEYPNLVHAGTHKITFTYPHEPCLRKRKHKIEAAGTTTRILLQYC
jgi:hypothetical protein